MNQRQNRADRIRIKLREILKFEDEVTDEVGDEAEETDAELTELPLKDGSKLVTNDKELLAGTSVVFKVDDKGNQTPCEDGTYELMDGRTVVIKGGKGIVETVSEIEKPEDAAAETPVSDANVQQEEAPAGDKPADVNTDEKDKEMGDRLTALEGAVSKLIEAMQGMANNQEKTMAEVKTLSETPGDESIEVKMAKANKTKNTEVANNIKDKDMAEVFNLAKSFKNKR